MAECLVMMLVIHGMTNDWILNERLEDMGQYWLLLYQSQQKLGTSDRRGRPGWRFDANRVGFFASLRCCYVYVPGHWLSLSHWQTKAHSPQTSQRPKSNSWESCWSPNRWSSLDSLVAVVRFNHFLDGSYSWFPSRFGVDFGFPRGVQ